MSGLTLDQFPALNASLNGASAVLLVAAYVCIKTGRVRLHATLMIAAVVTSAVFLACYLTYHAQRPPKSLSLPWKWNFTRAYFAILLTHTVLAVAILPLIVMTLLRAGRRRWQLHRRIARVTLPLWFYVSVTGVIIYFMLYRIAPTLRR